MQQTIQAQSNPYAAPTAGAATISAPAEALTLSQILFSFRGRVPRRIYWGASLAAAACWFTIVMLITVIAGRGNEAASSLVVLLTYPVFLWISLAIQAKRWHDRGKSAWMVLISLIPIVGPLWVLIECGCLRGSEGPNQFGADPT